MASTVAYYPNCPTSNVASSAYVTTAGTQNHIVIPSAAPTTAIQLQQPVASSYLYQSKFKSLGISQVILGVICLILGVIVAIFQWSTNATGIWGGIWYIVAGSVGIASGVNPDRCKVVAGLVLSIIATVMAGAIVIVDSIFAVDYARFNNYHYNWYYWDSYYSDPTLILLTSMHAAIAFLSFCEFVIAIAYSVYCCKSGCGSAFTQVQQHPVVFTTQQQISTIPIAGYPVNMPGQHQVMYNAQQVASTISTVAGYPPNLKADVQMAPNATHPQIAKADITTSQEYG